MNEPIMLREPNVYRPPAGIFDEVFGPGGVPREYAQALVAELTRLGPAELAGAGRRRDAIFIQQGITFDATGEDGPVKDRPFPLDLVPRIMPSHEWDHIKRGLAQRIRALNHFVDDVYHAREIVHEGIVPWQLIVSRPNFARQVHGIRPPGGVYCHVAGCDLVRDADGSWRVLEDNVRTPSGISYVLENRTAMTRLVPQLFNTYRVRPVDHYPQLLLAALRAVAPAAEGEATVVVWTPGSMNSAYFEHSFLARQMGVELVEASDLVVRDDVLYMRTTSGLKRVHAVYRRLDDDFIDPLEFRPDSLLGVPGLMRAYRAGSVALANAVGTGVADDKAVYHYVPDMIRFYLGEEPILQNVKTYLLGDPEQCRYALERMDRLVFKPTGESGGKGVFIGPSTPADELEGLREVILRSPEKWIAQEVVKLSTVPTAGVDGTLAPRHVDLRPFAVFGEKIKIVPGGLTRVAMQEGQMIVNSSRGGGSKDTWVLDDGAGPDADQVSADEAAVLPPALPGLRYAEWTGQAQQQQQAQISTPPTPR
ncbi:MAG: circularly permuted type 2 ATP-grasp protein [Solirubrobacteraceae bacterium]